MQAGCDLAVLHLNFDDFGDDGPRELAQKAGVALELPERPDYRVEKRRRGGRQGDWDKSVIKYNSHITIRNIPAEAYGYVINGKSAIDWVVDRQQVKPDTDSGIVNDPNAFAKEKGDPAYPLKLLLKVIWLSMETQKIIRSLPKPEF